MSVIANPNNHPAAMVDVAAENAKRIEAAIRDAAAKQVGPDYVRHLEWLHKIWKGPGEFVLSVMGDEYDGLNVVPDIMERRLALRKLPRVAKLIAEGVTIAATTTVAAPS